MFDFDEVASISGALAALCIAFFFYKKDEVPLVLFLLYATNGLYRYYVVVENPRHIITGWVRVAYAREIFVMDNDIALVALNYFLLGTGIFCMSYMAMRLVLRKPKTYIDESPILFSFIGRKKTQIIAIYCFILLASYIFQSRITSGFSEGNYTVNLAGMSYFLYLPFALGGVIILMYLIFRGINFQTDPVNKGIYLALICLAAQQSYNPGARFNFISWALVVLLILVRNTSIWRRAIIYMFGALIGITVFSIAGLVRTPNAYRLSFDEKVNVAMDRLLMAEDQNLLDGLMMVLQVYPENLKFQYGFQHLEILLRPIPRSLWPGKPVGGYANKLGLNDTESFQGLTVGISETIYGTFFGEGGVAGIVVLSILYGFGFGAFVARSERYRSDMQYVRKGLVVASLLAIIRGGDLAGIVAFIGMSYWPLLILNVQYSSFIKKVQAWYNELLTTRRMAALAERLNSSNS